jgi:hypothetical protein
LGVDELARTHGLGGDKIAARIAEETGTTPRTLNLKLVDIDDWKFGIIETGTNFHVT